MGGSRNDLNCSCSVSRRNGAQRCPGLVGGGINDASDAHWKQSWNLIQPLASPQRTAAMGESLVAGPDCRRIYLTSLVNLEKVLCWRTQCCNLVLDTQSL